MEKKVTPKVTPKLIAELCEALIEAKVNGVNYTHEYVKLIFKSNGFRVGRNSTFFALFSLIKTYDTSFSIFGITLDSNTMKIKYKGEDLYS